MRFRHIAAYLPLPCLALTTVLIIGCGSKAATPTTPAISVSLNLSTASLSGGGSQGFTATVANDSANAGVTWSIGAGAGTLTATTTTGVTYTAPALIAAGSTVTLTATSKTDTTKSASATITLNPISVSLSTTSVSLGGNGTQAFTATVSNDPASAGVTWSIGTGAGALSSTTTTSTTYTAPTTITATSTVTLTATSKTDTTKFASATITLGPISVSLSTTTVTLAASAAQAFTATVANDSSGAGVTWSIGTGPGTLSATTTAAATFTAPHGLPAATTVTLTATSKTDTTKHATATITLTAPTAPASQWVYYNSSGNLAYKAMTNSDNSGSDGYDQVMDFSTAGYMQGAVAIPTASVAITVVPSGDTTGTTDTTALQNAINTVSAMTLNTTTGLRGAVLMAAGTFYVDNSLNINASGVVLRGSGNGGTGGTVINMVAASTPYALVLMAGTGSAVTSSSTAITDTYVPSGTLTLHVASTTGLAVGTNVIVQRPVTSAWVSFMGMTAADLGTTCTGGPCSWITVGNTGLKTERTITAISGNQITLDAPMSDSIDTTYTPGATLAPYTFTGRISQVGMENFSIIAPATLIPVGDPTYQVVMTSAVINAWVRNIAAQDTLESVDINTESKQVTVNNVAITHTITQTGSDEFEDFYIASATQILMDTVSDSDDNMYFFATSSETQGPNVLRNATFIGDLTIEPHQRWATGLLVESTTITKGLSTQGGVNFRNRGDYGTGHGWTIGWGVVWNTSGGTLVIQQPPGSNNWCIGCIGTQGTLTAPPGTGPVMPQGSIDSSGTNVFPASLYQAQLWQRLGQ